MPRLAPAGPEDGRVHDCGPAGRTRRATGAHRQGPGRRLRGPPADLPGHPPAILSKDGLGPALRALARRSAVPVELDLELPSTRLPERIEVAVCYTTSECLTNAAEHTRATVVEVRARTYDDVLEVVIGDDGAGGADPRGGSGLIGLTDRVEAIGGRLSITSPPGSGTTLTVRLPLPEVSADASGERLPDG